MGKDIRKGYSRMEIYGSKRTEKDGMLAAIQ